MPFDETAVSVLFQGHIVIFLDKETTALSFEFPGWAKHELKEPRSEPAIRGPREGFTETLAENIGFIRRWIADPRLRADQLRIGCRTKTKITVMYLSDVAQPSLVKEVKKRLSAIDIDGIIDSGYCSEKPFHTISDIDKTPLGATNGLKNKSIKPLFYGHL